MKRGHTKEQCGGTCAYHSAKSHFESHKPGCQCYVHNTTRGNRVFDGKKRCSRCGEVKPLEKFNRKGRNDSRVRPQCIACRKHKLYGVDAKTQHKVFENQGGCCALCGKEIKEGSGMSLDHDHATGAPRGLLCKQCNMDLGKHSAEWFNKAAKYLAQNPVYQSQSSGLTVR